MPGQSSIKTFIHSGDAGDTIYALPVLKYLAPEGGNLILGLKQRVRSVYTEKWASNIMPLLKIQPYIKDVWIQKPEDVWSYDMDPFRRLIFTKMRRGKNISSYVCDAMGVPYNCYEAPWLMVDQPVHVEGKPVVVNRSGRYHNPSFPWGRVASTYRNQMVFVGMEDEWHRFCADICVVPYCPTENALELARMIAGCRLFIGNQSFAYSIAEGLKQNTLQETNQMIPDCMFVRHNAKFGMNAMVDFPELKNLQ